MTCERALRLRGPRARLAATAGYTLIEMLIAVVTSLVVTGAIATFLVFATRTENRDQQWALAIQESQTGLSRMMREIRQATLVNWFDASSIDFNVIENGQPIQVAYYCNVPQPNPPSGFSAGTFYECVRYQGSQGGSLPTTGGTPVILRVKNPTSVFTTNASLNPTYVAAQIQLPSTGELAKPLAAGAGHDIWLSSGAYLRNAATASSGS